MESLETESNTRFASNYIDSFFTKLPYDSRFNKIEYQKFVPVSGMSESVRQIDFVLERRDAPMCYKISDILIECNVTFLEETTAATLPAKTALIGPVNNILHSLFQRVTMKLNGCQVTDTPDNYCYKSYLVTLMSYSNEAKTSTLESTGFHIDSEKHMGTEKSPINQLPQNTGWWNRISSFKKNFKSESEFRKEGATFLGRLNHELTQSAKPLPPQMLVQITLNRTSDDFFIMKCADDTKKYKAVINYCCLYVPIAFMQMEMLRELEVRWPKEPITYHYRRHNILKLSVHRNKKEYFSDALFAESENPIRIYMFLVETDACLGTQTTNPYNFCRSWEYLPGTARLSLPDQLEEQHTQNELGNIKQMLSMLMAKMENIQNPPPMPPPADPEEQPLAKGKKLPPKRTTRSTADSGGTAAEGGLPEPTAGGSQQSLLASISNMMFRRSSQTPSEHSDFETIANPSLTQLETARQLINEQIEKERNKPSTSSARSTHSHHDLDSVSVVSERANQYRNQTVGVDKKTFWLEKCQLELNSQPLGYLSYFCKEIRKQTI